MKNQFIEMLPKGWKLASLLDVADYINGYPFRQSDWDTKGIPIVRIQNLNDPRRPFNFYSKPLNEKLKRVLIDNGDLLFAWSASLGFYIWRRGKALLNQHIYKVNVRKHVIDKLYLYYVGNFYLNRYVKSFTVGSTMKHLRKSMLRELKIPLPPLDEQRKIARILYTVDEAIAKTDTIISKVEELRRALLEYLMTHGIGHKEYRETEIGKIPKEWKVVKNGDVAKIDTKSIRPKAGEKYYYIGLEDIESQTGRILKNENELVDGSQIKSTKYVFSKEHVLYGRLRPYLNKVALPIRDGICSTDILPILPNKNLILREYLAYLMRHPRFVEWATSRMKGTNHPRISSRDILEYRISLPPIDEQKKIVEIISSVETLRDIELQKKEQLTALKSQLINLLLTGKVRVKDLPID